MAEAVEREVVVITGASAGVGRATVRAFARRGARIGLLARGSEGLEGAKREAEELGGEALVVPTDVADAEQVESAARRVEEAFGPIDIWVNCAMVTVFAPIMEVTPEEFRRVTDVTYLGYVYGTQAALRRMLPRDRGTVVQVGSALAYRGIPLQGPYCAAKHAILGFMDSLRAELKHEGKKVHVTMVQLPALNTPQFRWSRSRMEREAQPVPPIFQPEVAAEAIVWAAHHRRRELYVGAPTVKAIVGNKISSSIGDRLAAGTWDAQMIDEPRAERPDNLWEPLPGDHGAHGVFDARAKPRSVQHWANTHRGIAGAIVAGIGAVAVLVGLMATRR